MNKLLCIYHGNCADGFGAACIVRDEYGKEGVEFFAGHYGESPPDVTSREVLMVDFTYKRPILLEMAKQAKSILILDHHASAEKDLIDLPENVTVNFDMTRSGAMMAWDYFNNYIEAPQLIKHIQDRDLWLFDLPRTEAIQAALFSYAYDFELWNSFIFPKYGISSMKDSEEVVLKVLYKDGIAIARKHSKDVKELIEAASYRGFLADYEVPMLNAPYFYASEAGHELCKGESFAVTYYDTGTHRKFSLRSDKVDGVDVSEIAKKYGGGGHKNAAGFAMSLELLDELL